MADVLLNSRGNGWGSTHDTRHDRRLLLRSPAYCATVELKPHTVPSDIVVEDNIYEPRTSAHARYERENDLEWIEENMECFWSTATAAFEKAGRGVIVVDATEQPILGAGHPFSYFPQEQVESYDDDDISRMTSDYDPTHELVVVLLKPEDRVSTYRIGARPSEPESQPPQESKLQPPSLETLMRWEMQDGGCEAACEHGCWVEPDGSCPHGKDSWLILLGLV